MVRERITCSLSRTPRARRMRQRTETCDANCACHLLLFKQYGHPRNRIGWHALSSTLSSTPAHPHSLIPPKRYHKHHFRYTQTGHTMPHHIPSHCTPAPQHQTHVSLELSERETACRGRTHDGRAIGDATHNLRARSEILGSFSPQ